MPTPDFLSPITRAQRAARAEIAAMQKQGETVTAEQALRFVEAYWLGWYAGPLGHPTSRAQFLRDCGRLGGDE